MRRLRGWIALATNAKRRRIPVGTCRAFNEGTFSQAVRASDLGEKIFVADERGRRVPFRIGTAEEATTSWRQFPLDSHELVEARKLAGTAGTLVLFPKERWPSGELRVALAAGAPAVEGPLPSERVSAASADIAPPFSVVGIVCGPGEDERKPRLRGARCPANGQLWIRFSTQPLLTEVSAKHFRGTYDCCDSFSGSLAREIGLEAPHAPHGLHKIEVDETLRDDLGQPLVGARTIEFSTGPAHYEPWLSSPSGLGPVPEVGHPWAWLDVGVGLDVDVGVSGDGDGDVKP